MWKKTLRARQQEQIEAHQIQLEKDRELRIAQLVQELIGNIQITRDETPDGKPIWNILNLGALKSVEAYRKNQQPEKWKEELDRQIELTRRETERTNQLSYIALAIVICAFVVVAGYGIHLLFCG